MRLHFILNGEIKMDNKSCETNRKRICYSKNECRYSGENIGNETRKCNAYEMSEGSCVSCSGLCKKNMSK